MSKQVRGGNAEGETDPQKEDKTKQTKQREKEKQGQRSHRRSAFHLRATEPYQRNTARRSDTYYPPAVLRLAFLAALFGGGGPSAPSSAWCAADFLFDPDFAGGCGFAGGGGAGGFAAGADELVPPALPAPPAPLPPPPLPLARGFGACACCGVPFGLSGDAAADTVPAPGVG